MDILEINNVSDMIVFTSRDQSAQLGFDRIFGVFFDWPQVADLAQNSNLVLEVGTSNKSSLAAVRDQKPRACYDTQEAIVRFVCFDDGVSRDHAVSAVTKVTNTFMIPANLFESVRVWLFHCVRARHAKPEGSDRLARLVSDET